ncbi:hypothetical protein AKG60_18205 [Vibrio parahaemolyticus]|uniref:Transposase n=1 Tax=Vibrio parahaemolyticus TaxID=670 RepID=A0AAX0MC31_VIBPH|nr:transposase [Vibrio parahaemolyticus]EGR3309562.1 transposase [Vibrio parahaemolyticus]EJG0023761.1 transposase [Vibrio parahaemolyticus]MCS0405861.1 transposase [Vibrio diabolicus]OQJ97882.1 hypothetical protein AKG60_18205 [Vibrio parahaemolyticus]
MKILRAFKFRLKVDEKQQSAFWKQAGACRFVWNLFLKRQQYRLKRGHYVENYATMCLHLTQVKKHFSFLKEVDSTVLQQTLKDLDKAYKDAFDKTQPNKRMPVIKKRSRCNNGFRYTGRFKVEGRRVYLPKLGFFGFFKSRDIIGKIKNTTVTHKAGHWYVSFQTEYKRAERPHYSKSMVGVDLGVRRLATLSNGFYVDGLSALKVHSKTLARLQRKLAKKTRFSNNWKKVKQKITRLHRKISAVRHDFLHKFSSYLSKNHAIIVFEDLKVKNMTQSSKGTLDEPGKKVKQKSGLNKSILEQGWGMLMDFCKYKQQWKSGMVLKVDPKGTSQTCSCCGHKSKTNRLSQSEFVCEKCGLTINADDNASLNILASGHGVLACGNPNSLEFCKQESTGFVRSQPLLIK